MLSLLWGWGGNTIWGDNSLSKPNCWFRTPKIWKGQWKVSDPNFQAMWQKIQAGELGVGTKYLDIDNNYTYVWQGHDFGWAVEVQ